MKIVIYSCGGCATSYPSEKERHNHRTEKHKFADRSGRCAICRSSFDDYWSFYDHFSSAHRHGFHSLSTRAAQRLGPSMRCAFLFTIFYLPKKLLYTTDYTLDVNLNNRLNEELDRMERNSENRSMSILPIRLEVEEVTADSDVEREQENESKKKKTQIVERAQTRKQKRPRYREDGVTSSRCPFPSITEAVRIHSAAPLHEVQLQPIPSDAAAAVTPPAGNSGGQDVEIITQDQKDEVERLRRQTSRRRFSRSRSRYTLPPRDMERDRDDTISDQADEAVPMDMSPENADLDAPEDEEERITALVATADADVVAKIAEAQAAIQAAETAAELSVQAALVALETAKEEEVPEREEALAKAIAIGESEVAIAIAAAAAVVSRALGDSNPIDSMEEDGIIIDDSEDTPGIPAAAAPLEEEQQDHPVPAAAATRTSAEFDEEPQDAAEVPPHQEGEQQGQPVADNAAIDAELGSDLNTEERSQLLKLLQEQYLQIRDDVNADHEQLLQIQHQMNLLIQLIATAAPAASAAAANPVNPQAAAGAMPVHRLALDAHPSPLDRDWWLMKTNDCPREIERSFRGEDTSQKRRTFYIACLYNIYFDDKEGSTRKRKELDSYLHTHYGITKEGRRACLLCPLPLRLRLDYNSRAELLEHHKQDHPTEFSAQMRAYIDIADRVTNGQYPDPAIHSMMERANGR